jgi:DNA modification methylase
MAVINQDMGDDYSIYNGDCIEVMSDMPSDSIHLSIYSPPFGGLYNYSGSDRDLSNCRNYEEFFEHYSFVVEEIQRLTLPGRMTAVHCMDVPENGANIGGYIDFPGDIIRLHQKHGFKFWGRYAVWKEPLGVRNRTMMKGLTHQTVVEDSTNCSLASADYLLVFKNEGENTIPVEHPTGLMSYAGARQIPNDIIGYRGWKGKQTENRYSHWIWRQYASAFWDDVRIDRVLPYKQSKEPDDEKHVHPLQLDVIERIAVLWSNPNEVIFTPFMGVGSEVYGALINGRKGVGVELKTAYYKQAKKNVESASKSCQIDQQNDDIFGDMTDD